MSAAAEARARRLVTVAIAPTLLMAATFFLPVLDLSEGPQTPFQVVGFPFGLLWPWPTYLLAGLFAATLTLAAVRGEPPGGTSRFLVSGGLWYCLLSGVFPLALGMMSLRGDSAAPAMVILLAAAALSASLWARLRSGAHEGYRRWALLLLAYALSSAPLVTFVVLARIFLAGHAGYGGLLGIVADVAILGLSLAAAWPERSG